MSTATERTRDGSSTRERILSIALELFTEQGYEKTSLRDISERLGTTKAALYYHFKSKAAILLELHLRMHAIGIELLDEMAGLSDPADRIAAWPAMLDRLIDSVEANRELVALHQRNQSAFEDLHRADEEDGRHAVANDDIERRFAELLSDPGIPALERVRMASSIGAVILPLLGGSALLGDVTAQQLTAHVRTVVRELFAAPAADH